MIRTEELMQALTIRPSTPTDGDALELLAELDSSRPLPRPALVAEVGDEIWAAISLVDHRVIADPFRPSGEVTPVLVESARQMRDGERRRRPYAHRFGTLGLARP
jgi:hypothetical protein